MGQHQDFCGSSDLAAGELWLVIKCSQIANWSSRAADKFEGSYMKINDGFHQLDDPQTSAKHMTNKCRGCLELSRSTNLWGVSRVSSSCETRVNHSLGDLLSPREGGLPFDSHSSVVQWAKARPSFCVRCQGSLVRIRLVNFSFFFFWSLWDAIQDHDQSFSHTPMKIPTLWSIDE